MGSKWSLLNRDSLFDTSWGLLFYSVNFFSSLLIHRLHSSPVAPFTKEVNPRLAKCPLKTNGHLANRGLTSLVKEATVIAVFPIHKLSLVGIVPTNALKSEIRQVYF